MCLHAMHVYPCMKWLTTQAHLAAIQAIAKTGRIAAAGPGDHDGAQGHQLAVYPGALVGHFQRYPEGVIATAGAGRRLTDRRLDQRYQLWRRRPWGHRRRFARRA